jgi:hypothetical protein
MMAIHTKELAQCIKGHTGFAHLATAATAATTAVAATEGHREVDVVQRRRIGEQA